MLTFRYSVPLYNLFQDKTVWFLASVLRVWWLLHVCIMCSGLATQSSIDSSQQCKLQLTGCHTYTPTYVWSSNTCYWYLVGQKKQWSSNRITYRIAGNFCGRTFYKMVGKKKDLFREHFHKLLTCANKKHPCSQILWRKLSCITTRAQKSWKFLPWKFPTIQYQWMAYLYSYVVKALVIITGDSMAQFEAIYLLVLIQLMHRSLERDKGCILKKQ